MSRRKRYSRNENGEFVSYKRRRAGKKAYRKRLKKEGVGQVAKAIAGLAPGVGEVLAARETYEGLKKIRKASRKRRA